MQQKPARALQVIHRVDIADATRGLLVVGDPMFANTIPQSLLLRADEVIQ